MIAYRRVVFDTSTLVSAALRVGSAPHRALAHALATAQICASRSTLAELESVLKRDKFDRYLSAGMRAEFAAIIRSRSLFFEVSEAVNVQDLLAHYKARKKAMASKANNKHKG